MSITAEARRAFYSQKVPRSVLNRVVPGSRLRLRADAYKWLKEREWIFNKMEADQIHLLHENRAYGVIVRMEDIDWSDFHTRPSKGGRRSFFQAEDRKDLKAAESLSNATSDSRAHRPNMSQTLE
ncbi:MAG: hypothetical protein ACE144_21100 [Thermodesulfobacteriota bacterium]